MVGGGLIQRGKEYATSPVPVFPARSGIHVEFPGVARTPDCTGDQQVVVVAVDLEPLLFMPRLLEHLQREARAWGFMFARQNEARWLEQAATIEPVGAPFSRCVTRTMSPGSRRLEALASVCNAVGAGRG